MVFFRKSRKMMKRSHLFILTLLAALTGLAKYNVWGQEKPIVGRQEKYDIAAGMTAPTENAEIQDFAEAIRARGMTAPTKVVHLYPKGQHVDEGIVENGIKITQGPGEANRTDTTEYYWDRDGSLNAVGDSARIVLYLPEQRNGQLILVCPGGGYNELMFRSEGTYAAQVLTARGYSVGIVCYRMPTGHAPIPLTDVQNAFRYCRYHAAEWGVRQIGIMGMSAGGHLAACASTLWTDAVTRPDFAVLFYPVVSADPELIHRGSYRKLTGLDRETVDAASKSLTTNQIDPELKEACELIARYTPDRNVTAGTPPTLLLHSINDGVNPAQSLSYFKALTEAGVKAELHIFPQGGHGWGFNVLETAGRDRLGSSRPVFYAALFSFLDSLQDGTIPTNQPQP